MVSHVADESMRECPPLSETDGGLRWVVARVAVLNLAYRDGPYGDRRMKTDKAISVTAPIKKRKSGIPTGNAGDTALDEWGGRCRLLKYLQGAIHQVG